MLRHSFVFSLIMYFVNKVFRMFVIVILPPLFFFSLYFFPSKSAAALFGVAGVLARKTTVCFTVKVVNAFKVLALGHTDVLFDPNLWCKFPNSAQKDSCTLE